MIRCAALKIKLSSKGNPIIICGIRHGDCYSILHDLEIHNYMVLTEGFVTKDNIFLDRHEAFARAKDIGQISPSTLILKKQNGEDELYSEDLW